jgi:hypothetical protein
MGVTQLVLVPTSAQPPLGRLDRYADPDEKGLARPADYRLDIGITRVRSHHSTAAWLTFTGAEMRVMRWVAPRSDRAI